MTLFFRAIFALICFLPFAAQAGEVIHYNDDAGALEGYYAPSTCGNKDAPVILIVHQWKGLGDYEKMRADMMAENCFNAFAVDMYGTGVRPTTNEEAGKESAIYKNDPILSRRRLNVALAVAKQESGSTRAGVMGYCFGGGMALELARSGAPVEGAVSFHGVLSSIDPVRTHGVIKAKILALHGGADPFVPPEEVDMFATEMKQAGAAMKFISYPGAVHAFTQKDAGDDPSKGIAYNADADQKSWAEMIAFFDGIFGVSQQKQP